MGKPLGKNIGLYVPEKMIERLDDATKSTKIKSRSKMIEYILEQWLDSNGY